MYRILIVYSTVDGHTLKICQRLLEAIEAEGHRVTLSAIDEAAQLRLDQFDKIVIGASIRYGHHRPAVKRFVQSNQVVLSSRPSAFFSVNLVARKPDRSSPDSNPYLRVFLRGIAWQPRELAVFAGRLNYRRYRWFDRLLIRLIMWLTKGPTDPDSDIEFTDWHEVERFGHAICRM